MTIKRNRLMRVAAGVTATAVVGSLGVFATGGTVSAAPGDGGATLSVSSGTEATSFDLGLVDPGSQICPPDSVSGNAGTPNENFRASGFITQSDPATLNFAGANFGGAPGVADDGVGTAFPIVKANGDFAINSLPAQPNGNLVLSDFAALDFQNPVGQSLSDGVWNIGIACFDGDTPGLPQERFWSTQITVSNYSAGSFDWEVGAFSVPSVAIGNIAVDPAALEATVDFTGQVGVNPAIDSFTATVTPINPAGAALPVIPLPASATDFTVTGLTLGTEYQVDLFATNGLGDGPVATDTFTVELSAPISVEALDVFEGDDVIVTWDAPAGPAPDSYDVVIAGTSAAGAAVNVSQNVVGLSATFSNDPVETVPVGSYTATVTGVYSAAGASSTGSDTVNVTPGALVRQELTVTRPAGALILTQRCGVWNDQPAFDRVDAFPGFPRNLAAISATANQTGTAPIDDATGAGDAEFGNYPFPNRNYANPTDVPFGNVTECGLDMGVAQLQLNGNLSGQFFVANGRLNEVTVLDTRDGDTGWTLRGDIEDRFVTVANGDSFSGDYLGWVPQMTDDSDEVGGEGPNGSATLYDQTVTPGPTVLPGTGFDGGVTGMTSNPVLAEAAANAGLGISTHDARMLLLVPVSVDAADYSATLTLTVG